uniref:(northern house mosquito) hypothetical protein n=1 Tax=Culex pipiens TaxID=7175 RepID=A0A8D8CH07_CULPI
MHCLRLKVRYLPTRGLSLGVKFSENTVAEIRQLLLLLLVIPTVGLLLEQQFVHGGRRRIGQLCRAGTCPCGTATPGGCRYGRVRRRSLLFRVELCQRLLMLLEGHHGAGRRRSLTERRWPTDGGGGLGG